MVWLQKRQVRPDLFDLDDGDCELFSHAQPGMLHGASSNIVNRFNPVFLIYTLTAGGKSMCARLIPGFYCDSNAHHQPCVANTQLI